MDGIQHTVQFDLSGISVRIEGLERWLADWVTDAWSGFRTSPSGDPFLRVQVTTEGEPATGVEPYQAKTMRSRLEPERARFDMPEGEAEAASAGPVRVRLRPGPRERAAYTLLNLVRASLAWRLPSRGALLIHAAGIELDGRGFILVGSEGSGKSTWASQAELGGAHVVSDDLLLVDREGDRFALVGAPFRSTHPARQRRGRWPLAAICFPRHGTLPGFDESPPLIAQGRLLANLPFVAEALEWDTRLPRVVNDLAHGPLCGELTFDPSPAFLATLRSLPGRC